jgi:hypothetical protein
MLVAAGAAAQTGAIAVVDGDPVKVAGVSQRLMGFDCPETFSAPPSAPAVLRRPGGCGTPGRGQLFLRQEPDTTWTSISK